MATPDDTQKLTLAINQLDGRLKELESKKDVPEYLKPRDAQQERKDDLAVKRAINGSTPVSPRRFEEIKHRYSELNSPSNPAIRSKGKPAEDLKKLKFYCWKDGVLGTVQISIASNFAPL